MARLPSNGTSPAIRNATDDADEVEANAVDLFIAYHQGKIVEIMQAPVPAAV